jgi:hypothetical protein
MFVWCHWYFPHILFPSLSNFSTFCKDCVSLLLDSGADPNTVCGKNDDETPLLTCITHKRLDCARCLLKKGAIATPSWYLPFLTFFCTFFFVILKKNRESLVDEAILGDGAGCLDILLEHGAKVDTIDQYFSPFPSLLPLLPFHCPILLPLFFWIGLVVHHYTGLLSMGDWHVLKCMLECEKRKRGIEEQGKAKGIKRKQGKERKRD